MESTADDDWCVECSDEETYCGGTKGEWEPSPADIVRLYTSMARGDTMELEWKCERRRSPSPENVAEEEPMETVSVDVSDKQEVAPTEFDFDDIPVERSLTPRRTPGSAKTPRSGQKRVASMEKIMGDIMRRKEIDAAANAVRFRQRSLAARRTTPQRPPASSIVATPTGQNTTSKTTPTVELAMPTGQNTIVETTPIVQLAATTTLQDVTTPAMHIAQLATPTGHNVTALATPTGHNVTVLATPTGHNVTALATTTGHNVTALGMTTDHNVTALATPAGLDVTALAMPTAYLTTSTGQNVTHLAMPTAELATSTNQNVTALAMPTVTALATPTVTALAMPTVTALATPTLAPPTSHSVTAMSTPTDQNVTSVATPTESNNTTVAFMPTVKVTETLATPIAQPTTTEVTTPTEPHTTITPTATPTATPATNVITPTATNTSPVTVPASQDIVTAPIDQESLLPPTSDNNPTVSTVENSCPKLATPTVHDTSADIDMVHTSIVDTSVVELDTSTDMTTPLALAAIVNTCETAVGDVAVKEDVALTKDDSSTQDDTGETAMQTDSVAEAKTDEM